MTSEPKTTVPTTEGEVEVTREQIVKREEKAEALGKAHKTAGTVTDKAELKRPEQG